MKYVHVYSSYRYPDRDSRRIQTAMKTWGGGMVNHPVLRKELIRDRGGFPYVSDIVLEACRKYPESTILFTNIDTYISASWKDTLIYVTQPIAVLRRDFERVDDPIPPEQILSGKCFGGFDLFVATAGQWEVILREYPDFVFAHQDWDLCMAELFKKHGGSILDGLIYHETHPCRWIKDETMKETNAYNAELWRKWKAEHGIKKYLSTES